MSKAPLRIGLIGIPNSGKSKIAKALKRELSIGDVVVVDNYAQKAQRRTGLALGQFASYSENWSVAGTRLFAEWEAMKKSNFKSSIITVGTQIESLLYCATTADMELQNYNRHDAAKIAQVGIEGMGLFLAETWAYDVALYLPITEKQKSKDNWSGLVDSEIPNVIFNFSLPTYTIEGNDKERVQKAKSIVQRVYSERPDLESPSTDKQTVRDSGSSGGPIGDPFGSVSNVPEDKE